MRNGISNGDAEKSDADASDFLLFCERGSAAKEVRVYLKTGEVTGSEEFSWRARHFFAGILTYFKEK